jgi:hypothetical protein
VELVHARETLHNPGQMTNNKKRAGPLVFSLTTGTLSALAQGPTNFEGSNLLHLHRVLQTATAKPRANASHEANPPHRLPGETPLEASQWLSKRSLCTHLNAFATARQMTNNETQAGHSCSHSPLRALAQGTQGEPHRHTGETPLEAFHKSNSLR